MQTLKQAQTTDDIEDRLENARANTATDVTDGNAAAGNYRKGRFNYHGLRISIENPKGSTRSGTGEDGKRWSRQLKYDYGYIRGTMGADGDPLDVFIGDNPKSEMVYVLNQNRKDGSFDEHKVILGAMDAKQAKQTYLANYEAGWSRTGSVIPMTLQQFKDWATSDATEKPAGEVKQAAAPTEAAAKLRALLIEGNPDRPGNPERMHTALSNMLRDRGYAVQRVSSADYSDVPDSDVAIGFSRGGGRLRFSNAPVRIGVGTQAYDGVPSVNHPRDNVDLTRPDDFNALSVATQRAHSTLTPGMRKQIEALLQPQLVKQAEAPALPETPKLPNPTSLPWRDRVEVFARKPHTGEIYGGQWDKDKSFAIPGGGIDPGEDAAKAAVREFLEETGIPINNARKLDFPTTDNPWSDDYRKQTGRNFAGSRTHYIGADVAGEPTTDKLDTWNAANRGYYSPEAALKMMLANKNYLSPASAQQRIDILKSMMPAPSEMAGGVKQAANPFKAMAKAFKPMASKVKIPQVVTNTARTVMMPKVKPNRALVAANAAASRVPRVSQVDQALAASNSRRMARQPNVGASPLTRRNTPPTAAVTHPAPAAATRPAVSATPLRQPRTPQTPVTRPSVVAPAGSSPRARTAAPTPAATATRPNVGTTTFHPPTAPPAGLGATVANGARWLRDAAANVPKGETFGQRPIMNTARMLMLDGVPGMRRLNQLMFANKAIEWGGAANAMNNEVNNNLNNVAGHVGQHFSASPAQQEGFAQDLQNDKWRMIHDATIGKVNRGLTRLGGGTPAESPLGNIVATTAADKARAKLHEQHQPSSLLYNILEHRNPISSGVAAIPSLLRSVVSKPTQVETTQKIVDNIRNSGINFRDPAAVEEAIKSNFGSMYGRLEPQQLQQLRNEINLAVNPMAAIGAGMTGMLPYAR